MTMEVRNLLSHMMLEMSGCESENLTPRKPNQVVVPMPPPQKSEELLQPINTSSQVSAEVAEASLEGIPTSISLFLWFLGPEASLPWWMQWSFWQMPTKPSRIC